MKINEEPNALKNEVQMRKAKLAALTDDALQQVTGGHNDSGMLDRILSEIYSWLEAHPNVTKRDVYDILKEKKSAYADELTADEVCILDELLNSFVS